MVSNFLGILDSIFHLSPSVLKVLDFHLSNFGMAALDRPGGGEPRDLHLGVGTGYTGDMGIPYFRVLALAVSQQ